MGFCRARLFPAGNFSCFSCRFLFPHTNGFAQNPQDFISFLLFFTFPSGFYPSGSKIHIKRSFIFRLFFSQTRMVTGFPGTGVSYYVNYDVL